VTSLLAALGAPALAVALNVAFPTPETTAFTVLGPTDGPSVQFVVARPSASVGVVSELTDPPPVPTTQVTTRPDTGLFCESCTRTTNGLASSVEGGAVWPSPDTFWTALAEALTV
jgi:hypothetical protein